MLLKAKIFGKDIGILSQKNGGYFFEYFDSFLESELDISPFFLPLKKRVFSGREFLAFEMIPSVFHDSLPDSFGSTLMAHYFKYVDGSFEAMKNPLRKLSFMGDRAIGAIEYEPIMIENKNDRVALDLKEYIENSRKILLDDRVSVIKSLTAHPSPGGARPKAFVFWNRKLDKMQVGLEKEGFDPWIVKFYEEQKSSLTKIEYIYFKMAKECGINVPEFDYITYGDEFHFAVKRFDRKDGKKLHLHTLSGLLNVRFDERGLISYEEFFRTILALTKSISELKEGYKLMVFNITTQSCDDHAKNFSFIMNEEGEWSLSPAYDLVYSFGDGVYKEHFLSLRGKRKNFTKSDLVDVGIEFGLSKSECNFIIEKTKECFLNFPKYAMELGIDDKISRSILQ